MRLRLFIVLFILPYTNITFFEEGGGGLRKYLQYEKIFRRFITEFYEKVVLYENAINSI